MVIAGEIGDAKSFPTQWKLVAYAGLHQPSHQSGEYERRGGITNEGSKWLRWILDQAAQHARQHDPRFKAFYERVAKRREPYRGLDQQLIERNLKRMNNLAETGLQATYAG